MRLTVAVIALLTLLQIGILGSEPVSRVVESFDWCAWKPAWCKAAGQVSVVGEHSPDLPGGKSLCVEIHFSGRGFEWFSVKPSEPIWIPGEAKSVTVRYKVSAPGCTVTVEFVDGWGRAEVLGKPLRLPLPVKTVGQWLTETFTVPEDWVRPIAIVGLNVHNWDRQNEPVTLRIWVDQIDAQTDLLSSDLQTGLPRSWQPNPSEKDEGKRQPPPVSLLKAELTSSAGDHVFAGETPTIVFRLWDWSQQPRKAKVSLLVRDFVGEKVFGEEREVNLPGFAEEVFAIPLKKFGWYQAEAALTTSDGAKCLKRLAFAFIPPPRELTETEKLLSPYGLNVHGGRENLAIETFRKAGVVWFRDYAFGFETMKRAKGDGRFDGWPWYHQLLWRYRKAGAKLLACLQGAIQPPKSKGENMPGAIGPTLDWRREIAAIVAAFPQVTHWELDNEYDFPQGNREVEERIGWANYRAYHKAFAEIVEAIGGGNLVSVEQGQAGIFPERIRLCVESGDYERIKVVNVHHYCGSDAPELNIVNFNPAEGASQKTGLFSDLLREAKRAATSDRKQRQLWLTEFGWDTLAGYVVSPFEQAVYLQRGWLLALAAGVDKAFWFYDFDSPEPKQFFDGCGLLTADGQPKLAFCSLAALTHLLPVPRYIGDCNAGTGTCGFVFETDGKLVAVLWSVESDLGPVVNFELGQLYDFLANSIEGRSHRLTRAPVFAIGISCNDRWFKQTAYSLDTPNLTLAAAGDTFPVRVQIRNNRDSDLDATVKILVPPNWRVDRSEAAVKVPLNSQASVEFNVSASPDEPEGFREVTIVAEESGQRVKEMRVRVLVLKPVSLETLTVEDEKGQTKLRVQIGNNSRQTISGILRFRLPKSWKVEPERLTVEGLKPSEKRTVEVNLTWTTEWQPGESAQAIFGTLERVVASKFIVPPSLRIRRAPKVEFDGRLDEWGEEWAVPFWMLRSTFGEPNVRLFLAWSPDGLYIAAEVRNSVVKVADPRSFWTGDCIELFVDTRNDKRPRSFELGDHQFWFVPLVGEGRVFAGQWKRGNEIPETRYDLPDVKSAVRKTEDGYIAEVLLPAKYLHGFKPEAGAKLGLNLNLTVHGKHGVREVYWHRHKDSGILNSPHLWGTVELTD